METPESSANDPAQQAAETRQRQGAKIMRLGYWGAAITGVFCFTPALASLYVVLEIEGDPHAYDPILYAALTVFGVAYFYGFFRVRTARASWHR